MLATKLAHSFTVQDLKMLGSIHPRELVNRRWVSSHKTTLSPNVLRTTEMFNRRVTWVTSAVLSVKPSKVQSAFKFFLALADELLKLHNFNGFSQVIYGLKSPWLRRGRWKDACDNLRPKHAAKWKEYCSILDSNNHGYRELVRSVLASDKSKSTRRIPCWNIFLSDLFQMDSKTSWFAGENKKDASAHSVSKNEQNTSQRRINISKVLQLYKFVHTHLYHGTKCGYTDIEVDPGFDQTVRNSLETILTQEAMSRLTKKDE